MEMRAQSKWGWIIAAYLFLAGMGAGAYVVGVLASFFGGAEWSTFSKVGIYVSWPCVLVGCGFLIADLGSPMNFWRAAMRPGTSWISRGTIIITIFMILSFLHSVLGVWPSQSLDESTGGSYILGLLGILFALGTMVYTGILLGASRPIAFWSTAMLPLLFLVSALSTGVMLLVVLTGIFGGVDHGMLVTLGRTDMVLLLLELIVLIFFFQATHRVPEGRESARRVLTGEVAPLFWYGVALLGVVAPLFLEILGIYAFTGGGSTALAVIASLSGIAGGLCLRQAILAGGIHAPLRAGRFLVGVPNV